MRKEIRAYGGTGALITRAFVDMLIVNPSRNIEEITVTLMDYDQLSLGENIGNANATNDFQEVEKAIKSYQKLHDMKFESIAVPKLEKSEIKLTDIRDSTFEDLKKTEKNEYSIKDLYGGDKALTIMQSCMTSAQFTEKNKNGCYADLSRNSMIAFSMQKSEKGFKSKEYNKKLNNGDIVIYVGSMDGGTGNTSIDHDLYALVENSKSKSDANSVRDYYIYSIRTLPYKCVPGKTDEADKKTKESVEKAYGVLENILSRPDYVLNKDESNKKDYKLDCLYLVGSYKTPATELDDTSYDGLNKKDNQHHKSHFTELTAALMMIDIFSGTAEKHNRVTGKKEERLSGYQDEKISYMTYSKNEIDGKTQTQRLKALLGLYVLLKYHLIIEIRKIARIMKSKGTDETINKSLREIFGRIFNYKKLPGKGVKKILNIVKDVVANVEYEYDILITGNELLYGAKTGMELEIEAVANTFEEVVENLRPLVKMIREADEKFQNIEGITDNFKRILGEDTETLGNTVYFDKESVVVTKRTTDHNADKILRSFINNNEEKLKAIEADVRKGFGDKLNNMDDTEKLKKYGEKLAVKLIDGLYKEIM